jgi:hypothetical protein
MSFRWIVIAGLIVAAAVPTPAAYAKFMDNPGPEAREHARASDTAVDPAAQSMQMQVLRDRGAPDPPSATPAHAKPSRRGFPWLDAALFAAALTALTAVGTGTARRRQRVAARA